MAFLSGSLKLFPLLKNGIWSKKSEIDLFDFTSFFLPWTFFNFLAPYVSFNAKDDDKYCFSFKIIKYFKIYESKKRFEGKIKRF